MHINISVIQDLVLTLLASQRCPGNLSSLLPPCKTSSLGCSTATQDVTGATQPLISIHSGKHGGKGTILQSQWTEFSLPCHSFQLQIQGVPNIPVRKQEKNKEGDILVGQGSVKYY